LLRCSAIGTFLATFGDWEPGQSGKGRSITMRTFVCNTRFPIRLLIAATAIGGAIHPALAQDAPTNAAPPARGAAAPAATPTAAAPAAATPAAPAAPAFPPYSGPLSANATPYGFDSPLGHVVVSGAVTGLAIFTSHTIPGDEDSRADISNGQVQFAVQAGIYSLPSLGTPYLKATSATENTYGPVPQAFIRIVPNAEWTITGGLIPTLYGAEYTFTFQNQNIERGLLWNQEPAVSRGIQVGYTKGKIAANVSLNDGFYSDKLNWLVGSLAYTINAKNSFTLVAGGNFDRSHHSSFATPVAQNNGELYNIIYTYKSGPWTVNPYVQYGVTHIEPQYGLFRKAESLGAAILVNRTFKHGVSVAARGEYEKSYGHHDQIVGPAVAPVVVPGSPNLFGYGPRADAFSLTLTPAIQMGPLFLRAEGSYTRVGSADAGLEFGRNGDKKDQARGLIEVGVLF